MGSAFLSQLHASHMLAFLLVGFYAWSRFNTPRTVRSETSRFQYLASCMVYVLSCEGLWLLITLAIEQNPQWLELLHPAPADGTRIDALEAPLVAALMLTTLLPSVPMLREFDAWILAFFHRMGEIPFGAVRWAQRMRVAAFDMPVTLIDEAKAYLRDGDDLPESLVGEISVDRDGCPQQYRFTRVLVLYVWLRNCRGRARFEADFPEEVDAFEKRMCSYFAQCVGFFTVVAQLSAQQIAALPDSAQSFHALSKDAYEDIRLMVARLLLSTSNRGAQIADRLKTLGFRIDPPKGIAFPMNLLALDWLGVMLIFAGATIATAAPGGDAISRGLITGLLVAINHCVAAAFAVLPKQLWEFANRRHERERPVLAYFMSGFLTFTVVLAISWVAYQVRSSLPHTEPLVPYAVQCKWLALSVALSVALAWVCDNFALEVSEPRWLRWAESIGLACCMALVGFGVSRWVAPDLVAVHWRRPPHIWLPGALSASIGALFGATIPAWYRQTMRAQAHEAPTTDDPFHLAVVSDLPVRNRRGARRAVAGRRGEAGARGAGHAARAAHH